MTERPAIPAELRRRILVEAGHRCAIHTCVYPDVDVHHIVPWEQRRKHEYENLIALCPNCHLRADLGEIDRLSLKMYKARLVAAFGLPEVHSRPTDSALGTSQTDGWHTATLREKSDDSLYEVELEFPEFYGTDRDIADLNVMLRAEALRQLANIRSLRLATVDSTHDESITIPSSLTCSYDVALRSEKLISIRSTFFHYGRGAAHPNHWTTVTNVQLGPLLPLELGDLFRQEPDFLKAISQFCIDRLTSEKKSSHPASHEWIMRGAGPDRKNFSKFNITEAGLFINFDEYAVDCYAAGPSNVFIDRSSLADLVNPKCAVAELWTTAQS